MIHRDCSPRWLRLRWASWSIPSEAPGAGSQPRARPSFIFDLMDQDTGRPRKRISGHVKLGSAISAFDLQSQRSRVSDPLSWHT
jgi:hypothetical protein